MAYYGEAGYLNLLDDIRRTGLSRETRNGVRISLFGEQLKFDLRGDSFPLLTTKKVFLRGVIEELLWFLRGSTDNNELNAVGVHIWDEWADEKGQLGPIYGHQWRSWSAYDDNDGRVRYIDQLANVIESLKKDPAGTRHVVSAWNVGDIPEMKLPPCHCLFQFYVGKEGLECHLYQRSADMFLGVPFNIASYALLTMIIGQIVGQPASKLTISFGDCHIYEDHLPAVYEQLGRVERGAPRMLLNPNIDSIDNLRLTDFDLQDYDPHPVIKAQVHK